MAAHHWTMIGRKLTLSYQPTDLAARGLYHQLGFVETSEWEGDEVVAR